MEDRSLVSSDTIVGIVGAVILTGAMVAVFYYEADRDDPGAGGDIGSGSQTFQARFTDHGDHQPSVDDNTGSLNEGQDESWDLAVPPFTFGIHVEVTGNQHDLQDTPLVGPASYLIEILDEDGEVVGSSEDGTLDHTMDDERSSPPQMNLTVSADSREDAQGFLDEYMDSPAVQANARNWTLRVTLQDNGFAEDDPTGQGDTSRSADVTVEYEHFAPELVSDE